jgi:N-methylhydantoinase A
MRADGEVLRVVNDAMAGAIRLVSLQRGRDPRDFVLFAFGGAGPLHAVALARELAIPKVLVPARPGITSALGCLVADVRHDFVRTVNQDLARIDVSQARAILAGQVEEGRRLLAAEGVEIETVVVQHEADMQFVGETHVLTVPISGATCWDISTCDLPWSRLWTTIGRVPYEPPSPGRNVLPHSLSVAGRTSS